MIHALRYEPQGQRQRFEAPEQQDRHIHLHLHLNLTFRARQERASHPNAIHLRRIFAALLAATVMPVGIFLFAVATAGDGPPLAAWENVVWVSSCLLVVAGLVLAWWAVGSLLSQAWRASPRGRLGLLRPLWLLLLLPLVAAMEQFGPFFVKILLAAPLLLVLLAQPIIIALLLGWVTHEARVLGENDPTQRKLGFGLVAGVALVLLGGLVWNLLFMQGGGNTQMIFLPAIPMVAVIVAIRPLVELLRSRGRMQAPPKDASPFDTGSAQES
ncbi:MAG TPA: hypothetical protein VFA09_03550 [Ktedonobacteraceae bacterium]|nr:hypothetical protein [Ktedonobacteraceae bacterium]